MSFQTLQEGARWGKWTEPRDKLSEVHACMEGFPEEEATEMRPRGCVSVSLQKGKDKGFWAEVRGPGVSSHWAKGVCATPRSMPGVWWGASPDPGFWEGASAAGVPGTQGRQYKFKLWR